MGNRLPLMNTTRLSSIREHIAPQWFVQAGVLLYRHSQSGQSVVSRVTEFSWVPLETKPASARTATMPKITVKVRMVL